MTAKATAIGAAVCVAVGVVVGILAYRHFTTPRVTIITEPGPVRTVLVDRPTVETRDVVRYVTDRTEAARLMAELAAAKTQVTTLTETLATAKSGGTGEIRYLDRHVPGLVKREASFSDWRLTFQSVDDGTPTGKASYALNQRFEALAAVGQAHANLDVVLDHVSVQGVVVGVIRKM